MAALLALCSSSVAQNDSPHASAWIRDSYSALRLIAGAPEAGGATRLAAIDITLDAGWKTYWRVPGDSGIPPQIDFSRSDNVASAEVLWPTPHVFSDGAGGQSIGYQASVAWPVRITPKDAHKPALLRADIHYAVCAKICVPAEAKAEISLPAAPGAQPDLITQALRRVPVKASIDDAALPRLAGMTRDAKEQRLLIDVESPCATPCPAPPVVLAEGPTPQWALSIPRMDKQDGAKFRYVMKLDGAPPGASFDGALMTITIMNESAARAFQVRLE